VEDIPESRPINRRTLLIGGGALVAGVSLLDAADAAASLARSATVDGSWAGGLITSASPGGAFTVAQLPANSGPSILVDVGPQTVVRADVSVGKTVMAEGVIRNRGETIAASRVIQAVFGSRSGS
jgi:hypothetical protein